VMQKKFYSVEFNSFKIAYAVKINDIMIETNQRHNLPRRSIKANQWMYTGKNTFEITLYVNPHFEMDLEEQNFLFKIVEHYGDNPSEPPKEMVMVEWKYTQGTKFPVVINDEFTLDIPFGNWVWLDANVVSEETLDKNSLNTFLLSMQKHLADKNFQELEPLLKTKATELSKAYYLDINERFRDQHSFFTEELFGNPTWGVLPIDFDSLFFRFHAENRLVEVLNKEGKSPIRSCSLDGYTFSIQLFLCYKNNQWILCR
jgi:hypothetical protein